jgi:hypothetical protein
MDKSVWSSWMRRLAEHPGEVSEEFAALALNEKELHKHAVIEKLPFDLAAFLASGEVNKERHTLLVVLYALEAGSNKPKPRPFMLMFEAENKAFSL